MATNTAASFTNHTGNASAGPFSISFSYLDEAEVDVTVDGVLKTKTTHYTFPSATTISFTSGNHPANGTAIKFQRDTNISAKKVDFQDGSVLTETDLDNNSDQILYGLQENLDVINNDILKRDGSQTVTGNLVFEGSTDDGNETTLAITDPTADRTITVPNITGTIVTTGDTGTVTSAMINDGTIVAGDLASNSVTTAKITDANVTTAKVADDAITSAKIADNAITSAHIADGTVVAADIGANAVTASELADDAVDTAAIANSAVTNAKLGADAVNGSKIADDSIDSEHYVDGSIDTAHIADEAVGASKLDDGAVTTAKVFDAAVTTAKLADDAVTAAKIADGVITSAHIAADTVVAADIAANAVTASELADNAVDTAAIAADAVTGAKIADDAINSEHYTDGSIDTAHIADAQITTAKIADDAVTAAKVGTFNLADLTNVHTATPSDGQVLKWVNSNSRWEPAVDAGASGATLGDGDYGDITVSASGAVFTIDNDVITSAKIADNAINSEHYTDGSIDTAHIAADQITSALIADDAVGSEHIEVLDATLQFGDSVNAEFGASGDLKLFHDGSNSYIKDTGTGSLKLASDQFMVLNAANDEYMIIGDQNESVSLYYDGSKQCKTASYGLDFADNKRADFGDGNDLLIYHDGSNSRITNATGQLSVAGDTVAITNAAVSENLAKFINNGAVELYYDNSKKLETKAGGIKTYGGAIEISAPEGADANLYMYADESDDNADNWLIQAHTNGAWYLKNYGGGSWETSIEAVNNGNVALFHDNSKKFETVSAGVEIHGNAQFDDNCIAKFGTGGDLEIKHDGSHAFFKNSTNYTFYRATQHHFVNAGDTEIQAKFLENDQVILYYDNSAKLYIQSWGAQVVGNFLPDGNAAYNLGASGERWWTIYASNALNTSDRNEKNTIIESDLGLDFINKLKPVSYKWNKDDGKTHYGLIAQDIEETVLAEGKAITDVGFIDKPSQGQMSLAYNELLSPLIKAIQELSAKVAALESA